MSEQPENNTQELKPRRLRRSVFILPSLFTVANLFCGYYAILSSMKEMYQHAAIAIGIAIILDSLDGFIARLTHSTSDFGLQLDSLSDVISFGVAPSILVFVWGFSTVDTRLAGASAFTFTICGAMRLARFNVQSGNRKHFVGLPIPAAGGTVAAAVYFFREPIVDTWKANLLVAGIFILAFLMVSTLRYNSLKGVTFGKRSHLAVLVIALLFALIFFLSRETLLTLAVVYVISGPIIKIYNLPRRKKTDADSPAPQS